MNLACSDILNLNIFKSKSTCQNLHVKNVILKIHIPVFVSIYLFNFNSCPDKRKNGLLKIYILRKALEKSE